MDVERLGLDVVHIGADAVEVRVHRAHDERRLRESGYDSRVLIADTGKPAFLNTGVHHAREWHAASRRSPT